MYDFYGPIVPEINYLFIYLFKFTLTLLGVTLVNLRGREHKLPRNFLLGV